MATFSRRPAPARGGSWGGEGRAAWTSFCRTGTLVLDARDAWSDLTALEAGASVVLVDGRWASRRRLRRLARTAGVSIERELVLIPSRSRPRVMVERTRSARTAWRRMVRAESGPWSLSSWWCGVGWDSRKSQLFLPGSVLVGRRR